MKIDVTPVNFHGCAERILGSNQKITPLTKKSLVNKK